LKAALLEPVAIVSLMQVYFATAHYPREALATACLLVLLTPETGPREHGQDALRQDLGRASGA